MVTANEKFEAFFELIFEQNSVEMCCIDKTLGPSFVYI